MIADIKQALKAWLDGIERDFQSSKDDRDRMVFALFALSRLFAINDRNDTANKLNDYCHWIGDLKRGVVHPIFKGTGARAPDPTLIWCARAMVAVAIEALMRSDMKRSEAATWVVRHSNLTPLLTGRDREPAAAALSWRDEFQKAVKAEKKRPNTVAPGKVARINNLSAAVLYCQYMRMLETDAIGSEQKFAKWLLNEAAPKTKRSLG